MIQIAINNVIKGAMKSIASLFFFRITEDGDFRVTEDGNRRITE
jgi:hypothetical protein